MSILLELRSTALVCRDELQRRLLREVADDLQRWEKAFKKGSVDLETALREMTGLYSRGVRLLSLIPPDDNGGGAKMRQAA